MEKPFEGFIREIRKASVDILSTHFWSDFLRNCYWSSWRIFYQGLPKKFQMAIRTIWRAWFSWRINQGISEMSTEAMLGGIPSKNIWINFRKILRIVVEGIPWGSFGDSSGRVLKVYLEEGMLKWWDVSIVWDVIFTDELMENCFIMHPEQFYRPFLAKQMQYHYQKLQCSFVRSLPINVSSLYNQI